MLMAILIGAICVTAYRVVPRAQVQAVLEEVAEPAAQTSQSFEVRVRNLSRNPFKAPDVYALAQARSNAAELGLPIPDSPNGGAHKSKNPAGTLPPLQPVILKTVPGGRVAAGVADHPQAKPSFILLATIHSEHGCSGVIKTDDSIVRVVNVGDMLEGGYKVKALKHDCAVLSKGEETILAKKPQS